jgi:hypothetical protein
MAYLPDANSVPISQFNGIWVPSPAYGMDPEKVPMHNGISGANVQYFGDAVKTRFGHSSVFTPGDTMTTCVNWIFTTGSPAVPRNFLAWFAPGIGLRYADLDLATPTPVTAIAQTTAASAFIHPFGPRLYVAFVDANGSGMAPGQVYGFGVGADTLFAPPIGTVPTFTDLGGTFCTAGAKLFGYLIQTRNGYITKPSPATGADFTATAYTALGGAILMTIDPPSHAWPDYALNVAAIMTTTANPALFFIVPNVFPGLSPFTPVNRTGPTVILIESTDQALNSTAAQDATPYLNQFGQNQGGSATIQPSMIFSYGARLGYVCLDASNIPVTYISDVSQPQTINAATSAIYIPGNQRVTLAYSLRNVLYIDGPHWTYSTSDTGQTPSLWSTPALVDGGIGALGAHCVALNASQNNCWTADDSGLYLFQGGAYPDKPISYYQRADWIRINFAAQNAIQIADDTTAQRVHVLVPLDGATLPTHILSWDYSNGPTPETVKYCGASSLTGYLPGAMAMIQSSGSKHQDKWLGPQTAGQPIGMENSGNEASPYTDFGNAIGSFYETSLLPRGTKGQLTQALAAQIRILGSGTAKLTVNGLDGAAQPDQPGPAQGPAFGPFRVPAFGSLQDSGVEYLLPFWAESEQFSLRIDSDGAAGSWFQWSRADLFFTMGMGWR